MTAEIRNEEFLAISEAVKSGVFFVVFLLPVNGP